MERNWFGNQDKNFIKAEKEQKRRFLQMYKREVKRTGHLTLMGSTKLNFKLIRIGHNYISYLLGGKVCSTKILE